PARNSRRHFPRPAIAPAATAAIACARSPAPASASSDASSRARRARRLPPRCATLDRFTLVEARPPLTRVNAAPRVPINKEESMFRTVFSLVAVAALFALVPPSAHAQTRSSSTAAAKAAVGVVNINTATVAELDALPGIGAKTAALIVEYRQKN